MLKNKTITTDKATLLVVEFPEYYRVYHRANGTIFCSNVRNKNANPVWDSSDGNWKLLGRMPEITEGYVYELIPEVITPIMGFKAYPNFDKDGYCKTALESLYSLLQANEVYFENKYGKEKPTQIAYIGNVLEVEAKSALMLQQMKWQKAQSKVWDKERCYIFIKVD